MSTAGMDAVPRAKRRHRLGAADGVDLLDAEERAHGQRAGVREPRGAGRRAGCDLGHARDLGRDDRHHGARRVGGEAAGDVDADPPHRHLPGRHDLPVAQRDLGRPRHLVVGDRSEVLGQKLQGGAHVGVEVGERLAQPARSDPRPLDVDAVQAQRQPANRFVAAVPDHVDDVGDGRAHVLAQLLGRPQPPDELADLRRRDASALPHAAKRIVPDRFLGVDALDVARRAPAGGRRCARSRGRSRRRFRSGSRPRRRARRSASPCRRGCRGSPSARRRASPGRSRPPGGGRTG